MSHVNSALNSMKYVEDKNKEIKDGGKLLISQSLGIIYTSFCILIVYT